MINLSIIIPHYNSSSSLDRLLYSIPSLDEIEIIIVDDHSDEVHKNRLDKFKEKYKKKNIKLYNNIEHKKGAGACRNIGIRNSTGKWILFADSDDYFLTNFYNNIKKYFNNSYEVIFFTPTSIEVDTGNISDRHKPYKELIKNYLTYSNEVSEAGLRYFFYVPWSKLIRRDFIKNNHIYFDEVIVSNDVMFSTKLGHSIKSFMVSEETIYCVTRNKGTLTTNISEKVFDTRMGVFIDYYLFLKNKLSEEDFKKLKLSGKSIILKSSKFGVRKLLTVYNTLKKNDVKIIDTNMFNPIWLIKKIISLYYKKKKMDRYI